MTFGSKEMKKRKKIPVFFSAFGIVFLLIWFTLWLPKSDFAKRYAKDHPEWAWRHGSPEMQRSAAQVLQRQILPGTDIESVVDLLGPGADQWPEKFERSFEGESVVGFNVRARYNNGLDIHYLDGKVVSVSYYD